MLMTKNYLGQECTLEKLNQFVGHRVEVSNADNSITFNYQRFNWEIDYDNDLVLMDETNSDCKTYIHMDDIYLIKNLNDDMWHDVIDLCFRDHKISVCCAESKPNPVKCDRCGHIFKEDEQIWQVNQHGTYGSVFDGDLISLRLDDACIHDFLIFTRKAGEYYV